MVNLAFDRDAPQAGVRWAMPRRGQLAVTAKADADFLLRAGLGARSAVRASQRQARGCPLGRAGHGLRPLSARKPGETLEIAWPLVKFTQRVSHKIYGGTAERSYVYTWIGSMVTAVDPPGQWLPLYGDRN